MSDISRPMRCSSLSLKDIVILCAGPRDDAAWEEFIFRVAKPISLTIMRTASLWGEPSRSLVEDLIQATYLKLWEGGSAVNHWAVATHMFPPAMLSPRPAMTLMGVRRESLSKSS